MCFLRVKLCVKLTDIESLMGMEPLFNFVWALVALASVCFWLKQGRRSSADGRSSLVGLVMLVVILFPVISVSDDLWSLQNPAESDTCQRRDHSDGCSHSHFPAAAALPEPIRIEMDLGFQRLEAPLQAELAPFENPTLGFVENRPPPTL
jgi:hypothetical protein